MIPHGDPEISRERAISAIEKLREQAKRNGVSDLSLSEINKEISATRAEKRKGH